DNEHCEADGGAHDRDAHAARQASTDARCGARGEFVGSDGGGHEPAASVRSSLGWADTRFGRDAPKGDASDTGAVVFGHFVARLPVSGTCRCSARRVTMSSASRAIAPDIFEEPPVRLRKTIGVSTIDAAACRARSVI